MQVAISLKNIALKCFGSREDYINYAPGKKDDLLPEEDPANLIDEQGKAILQ